MRTRDLCANTPESIREPTDLGSTVSVTTDSGHRIVHVAGELDLVTRNLVSRACLSDGDNSVVVEMADIIFMDCCGYGGLVAARRILEEHGGSLTLLHQVGQPAHLLSMLSELETCS